MVILNLLYMKGKFYSQKLVGTYQLYIIRCFAYSANCHLISVYVLYAHVLLTTWSGVGARKG
jgi:hypothetical protein